MTHNTMRLVFQQNGAKLQSQSCLFTRPTCHDTTITPYKDKQITRQKNILNKSHCSLQIKVWAHIYDWLFFWSTSQKKDSWASNLLRPFLNNKKNISFHLTDSMFWVACCFTRHQASCPMTGEKRTKANNKKYKKQNKTRFTDLSTDAIDKALIEWLWIIHCSQT